MVLVRGSAPAAPAVRRRSGSRCVVAVVLDRARSLRVVEQDRLDIEVQVDLVRDDDSAPRDLVLPGHAEVRPVDPGAGFETDASKLASVLVADPERCLPLPEVLDVQRDGACYAADRQLDLALER